MIRRIVAITLASAVLAGCSSTSKQPAATTPQPPPTMTTARAPASAASATPAATSPRQQFLERFARGYYPGRSGQIFLVPREGDIITYRDPLYAFMHGSPWPYDARIPVLFHGPPFIRQSNSSTVVTQQDVAPTLAAVLGIAPPATVTGRALREALGSGGRPRVIAVFVFDGMRAGLLRSLRRRDADTDTVETGRCLVLGRRSTTCRR